jgi:hypothetical protein
MSFRRQAGFQRPDQVGEEVDRFTSDDPRLLAFIGDRQSSAE